MSASFDQSIKIWDYVLGSLLSSKSNAHADRIQCLKVLKDGSFATASDDKTIKIWDSTTYALIKTLTDHTDKVQILDVLSSGLLTSGSVDKTVKIWNITTGLVILNFNPLSNPITCLKEASNGVFYIGGNTQNIAFYSGSVSTVSNGIQASSCNGFSVYNNKFLTVAQGSSSVDVYDVSSPTSPIRSTTLSLGSNSNCVESLRKLLLI